MGNLAGHKFPTGFPSRRVWVHLTVTDDAGSVLFESGRPLADGSIVGNNADELAGGYEPHYNRITDADQVQIYEPIMQDVNGDVTYTLLRGSSYIKDNRLLPAGFEKEDVSDDVAVRGNAFEDDNFVGGGDNVTYQIALQGASGPFTVSVELLYQTIAFGFVQDLLDDDAPQVSRFVRYNSQAEKTPVVVAGDETVVR